MKKKFLEKIAYIQRGYNLTRTRAKDEKTEYIYTTPKTLLTENGYISNLVTEDTYFLRKLEDDYITREGDIILKLVGNIEFSYIREKDSGFLITGNYVLIRLETNKILPRYLFYVLRELEGYLNALSVGSTAMKQISIRNVKEIEVPMVSMEKQKKICKTLKLYEKELELFNLKQEFYKSALRTLMEEKK